MRPRRVSLPEPKDEHHQWATRTWIRMGTAVSREITRDDLDCQELRTFLKKEIAPAQGGCFGGPRYALTEKSTDQAIDYIKRKGDLSGDKTLPFKEFETVTKLLRLHKGSSANIIFSLFDLNGDDKLNEGEFWDLRRFYAGENPIEEEIEAEMERFGLNAEKHITKEFYMKWLKASDKQGFRPWETYGHLCWHEPTKGKPAHCKMKFRDTNVTCMSCLNLKPEKLICRPDWDPFLASSNPNWPDKHGKPRRVVGQRSYFSRPCSVTDRNHNLTGRGQRPP